MERITAKIGDTYRIRKPRRGRPKKVKERKAYKSPGESSIWQFKFPKTELNEQMANLFTASSPEDLESRFGFKIDDDLEWKKGMKFITENILITIARRGVEDETAD